MLDGVLTWPHCGQTTVAARPGAAAGRGAGAARRCGATRSGAARARGEGSSRGDCSDGHRYRRRPVAAPLRGGLSRACMPCGGVCGENGFGAASRGSSAPHPRQNL